MGDVLTTITCFMCVLCSAVEVMRESFMMDIMDTHHGFPRPIKRAKTYMMMSLKHIRRILGISCRSTPFLYTVRERASC